MEIQVREHCWRCGGTGTLHDKDEVCDKCNGEKYIYEWMDIGEVAHEMERAKIA